MTQQAHRLVMVIATGLTFQGFSQTCCSGGVPLTNNIGGLPISVKGTWQFSLGSDLNVLKTLKSGSEVLTDDSRERTTLSILGKTSYAFSDKLFIESLLSWVRQERSITQFGGFTDLDVTRGVGDAVVMINYQYVRLNKLNLIGGVGPKIPTGASDVKDDNGLTLNADLQPGSGAWDMVFFHRVQAVNSNRPSQNYFLNATYRLTGTNSNYLGSLDYRFGNEWQVISGVADQFVIGSTLISTGLNIRFRNVRQDQIDKEPLPNTGGRWIFVMPAIGWHINPHWIVNLSTEVPLAGYVDGTQLSPSIRISGGVFYSIQKTKEQ
ncbi:MAG: hypothetical protein AB7O48_08885 [Cyclobacteriaceae bacterium]